MGRGRDIWPDNGFILAKGLFGDAELALIEERLSLLTQRALASGQGERGEGMLERFERSRRDALIFFDPTMGPEVTDACLRIHRLGHGLHHVDGALGDLLSSGSMAEEVAGLVGEPVEVVQSVLMVKSPGSRIQFEFHTDGIYIQSEPDTLVVTWLALDPCHRDNGTIRLLPGSHVHPPKAPPPCDSGEAVELDPGDVALWGGGLWHGSEPNRSTGPRRALITYYVATSSTCSIQPCRPGD